MNLKAQVPQELVFDIKGRVPHIHVFQIVEVLKEVIAECREKAPYGADCRHLVKTLETLKHLTEETLAVEIRKPVVRIEQDEFADNPNDWDEWRVLRNIPGLGAPDADGPTFSLDVYRHGCEIWSLTGEGSNCCWDTSRNAGLLEYLGRPEEATKQRAKRFLEIYNQWVSGDVYFVEVTDASGELIDSCSGLYGEDGVKHFLADVGVKDCAYTGPLAELMR
tara:strand:- start:196 stop:858 length:663 start_codon:yes stop_codon:yes gene_type:complete